MMHGWTSAQPGRKSAGGQPEKQPEEQRVPRVLSEEEWIRELDRIQALGDNDIAEQEMCQFLVSFAEYGASSGYVKLLQRIMEVPEFESFNELFPQYAYQFSCARLRFLSHFRDYAGVREFVLKAMESQLPHIQPEAAATLLAWGEWDLAAPVICKYEAYHLFQIHRDERAIPLLEEAVRSGSWQERILAAAALFYTYGDSTKYPQVALDIILNAPVNSTDLSTNRAKYMALAQVIRFNLTEALPGLVRLAQDTARGIAPTAVGYLVDLGAMGHPEATQALIDIKERHANANIREIARNGLLKLEEEQK